jgi:hypothetical protein
MTLLTIGLPAGGLRRALVCLPLAAILACSSAESGDGGQGGHTTARGGTSNAQGGNTNSNGGASTGGATTAKGGANSAGGATAAGGATNHNNGGTTAGAGTTNNGGSATKGGTTGTAGTTTSGGTTGTAGTTDNAGTTSSAGNTSRGGGTSTGGTTSTGGATSAGGTTNTGGTTTSGGTTASGGAAGSTSVGGCDVWIAPNGTATNPGTEAAPADLAHGYDLLCPPATGATNGTPCAGTLKTICAKAGTYTMTTRFEFKKTRMGTASRILTLQAAPNAATRPVFDFTTQPRITTCGASPSDGNQGGFTINADYVTVRGIEVKNANDNCVKVQGSHDTIDNVVVHDCADTGIQISAGSGYTGSGTNNLILNCDSYHNYDPQCNGENADGFGAKEATGANNIFRGCRSWENVDDGYDFYAWLSPVRLENCWSWSNAKTISAAEQDGNGFKLGGGDKGGNHVLVNSIAVSNRMHGFTNNSGANSTCTGCKSCSNAQADQGVSGITSSGCPSTSQLAAARGADGALPSVP